MILWSAGSEFHHELAVLSGNTLLPFLFAPITGSHGCVDQILEVNGAELFTKTAVKSGLP